MNRPTNPELIEDVQRTEDKRHLDIDQVGIRSIKHPVIVKDKQGGVQHTIANFNMYVHLPHKFKGTHMSRFVEILNENKDPISVDSFEDISKQMISRLEARSCDLEMTFPYFINKEAPISKVKKRFRTRLLIRSKNSALLQKKIAHLLENLNISSRIKLTVDVDPINFT